jgi:flagellar biosynthesis/type III secretory pathway protein FliH
LLVSQPPGGGDHVRTEVDAGDPARELGAAGDRARGHAGAAAQVQHAARRGKRETIEIGMQHGGKAGMAAPLLEARDHGTERGLAEFAGAPGGIDHALHPAAAS